jgi:hypothetical protein
MLTFDQIKAIENALGTDKAGPVIQALESVEERVKASLVHELVTKDHLDLRIAEIEARIKALEVTLTLRMGAMLAVVLAVVVALKVL